MKRQIILSVITVLIIALFIIPCPQNNKSKQSKGVFIAMGNQSVDLTKEVTVKKFQAIVKFVLNNGDRNTYCNRFNNSPRYKLAGFGIYLNPINQSINWSKDFLSNEISDYDEIVIYDPGVKIQYYHLKLSENKIFLENIYDDQDLDFMKKVFLFIYFPKIGSEIY